MAISPTTAVALRPMWSEGLPAEWRFARFGDVLRQVKRPISLLDGVEYVQPVIRRRHGGIEERGRQMGCDIKTKSQFELKTDDWLMSKVQILHGAYGVVPPEMDGSVASGSYFTFRARPNLFLPYFWYLSHLFQFQRTCAVSSVGVVIEKMVFRVEDWKDLEFPLPPLPEQERIAAILSSVDETIQTTQAVIEQTRRVKEGLLQELLTKGIGHTRFQQTEIGEIPEGWRLAFCGEFLPKGSIQNGLYKPANEYNENGTPIIRIDSFQHGGRVALSGLRRVKLTDLEVNRFLVRDGDILLNRVNSLSHLAKSAIVMEVAQATAFESNVMRLRLDPHLGLRPGFLIAVLSLPYAWNHFQFRAKKAVAQASVNQKDVRALPVPIPPAKEQEQIEQVLDQVHRQIQSEEVLLAHHRQLKSGLLQDLLTGKVRVSA